MALCYPWWHNELLSFPKTPIASGYSVNSAGNVPASPEALRAAAEGKAQRAGLWPAGKPLPLVVYTLGRYLASEVGSGSPEELVAVAEAAYNKARQRKQTVNDLLIYTANSSNRGYYGPIHGSSGTTSAPYGRWASTSRDPTARTLAAAELVLSGKSDNFAKGATTQWGLEYLIRDGKDPKAFVDRLAAKRHYWVGLLPGVDHFHTFLVRENVPAVTAALYGRGWVADAKEAVTGPRPDWAGSGLDVCPRSLPVGGLLLGVGLGVGLFLGFRRQGIEVVDLVRYLRRRGGGVGR